MEKEANTKLFISVTFGTVAPLLAQSFQELCACDLTTFTLLFSGGHRKWSRMVEKENKNSNLRILLVTTKEHVFCLSVLQ